jgi:hypothetical protein
MKRVIQLSVEHYERLLKYANQASPAYSTLKNGVKMEPSHGVQSEVIVILCDEDQAEMILRSAKHFCPEAVPQIEKGISAAPFTVP